MSLRAIALSAGLVLCGSSHLAAAVTYTVGGNVGTGAAMVAIAGKNLAADASGNFALSGLSKGAYLVTPAKVGCTFTPGSATVTINTSNVTVAFKATCTWTLRGDLGTAGATVSLIGITVASDGSGAFSKAGIPNGAYQITPTKPGCTFTPPTQTAVINGTDSTLRSFAATCGATVSGRAGAPGALVTIGGKSVLSNPDGSFSVTGVPVGSKLVSVSRPNCSFAPNNYSISVGNSGVTGVTIVATCTANLTISVGVPDVTVSVSNPLLPIGDLPANIKAVLTSNLPLRTVKTDSKGDATISGLPAATYQVTAIKSGCAFSPQVLSMDLRNGGGAANFMGSCKFDLTGVVNGLNGVTAQISLSKTWPATGPELKASSTGGGAFVFSAVEAGQYTLAVSGPGCRSSGSVYVNVPGAVPTIWLDCLPISGNHATVMPGYVCTATDAYFTVRLAYDDSYGPYSLAYLGFRVTAPDGGRAEMFMARRTKHFLTDFLFPMVYKAVSMAAPFAPETEIVKLAGATDAVFSAGDAMSVLGGYFSKEVSIRSVGAGWQRPTPTAFTGEYAEHLVHLTRPSSSASWPTSVMTAEWMPVNGTAKSADRFPANCK